MNALALLLLLPSSSLADPIASCRVTGASEAFAPFVGGKIVIGLANGHAELHRGDEALPLVNDVTASTFPAPTPTCRFRYDKILSGGRLRALYFYFSDCTYRAPEPLHSGYVDVRHGFDLQTHGGAYAELQRNGFGSRTNRLEFADCGISE